MEMTIKVRNNKNQVVSSARVSTFMRATINESNMNENATLAECIETYNDITAHEGLVAQISINVR